MPLLSREQFVGICTQAILDTRAKIEINNQISGYKKYHQENKENQYFTNVRKRILNTSHDDYMYRHDLVEHVGLGNCRELADFLLIEIAMKIEYMGAHARIRIVRSMVADHCYLEIKIRLNGECSESVWEVDAWDPRVIDISTRPDGTIKNYESLDYGYSADVWHTVYSDQINYRHRFHFFGSIPKPRPGKPLKAATLEEEMLGAHPELYSDYTMRESMEKGTIDPSGTLGYLQQASRWQS